MVWRGIFMKSDSTSKDAMCEEESIDLHILMNSLIEFIMYF